MDAQRYDVFLTGKLAGGTTTDAAAQRLAALFKSTPAAMLGMLNGKPQLLKRNIDKATALKYREALQKAGLEVAFKALPLAPVAAIESAEPMPAATAEEAPANSPRWEVASAGTDLLRPEERQAVSAIAIDTSHLSVAEPGLLPSLHTDIEPATPLIDHLSMAPLGDLLNESERHHLPPIAPAIDGLSLAPAGARIETLTTAIEAVNPDISQLTVAPAGADLLTDEQRRKPAIAAPDTTHLHLVKP